jgi:biopolymer transport protein ExbD
MVKFLRNRKKVSIPDGSTGDIAFLLLLFFMVTTVFVKEKKFWVSMDRLPNAESMTKIPRQHAATIYVTKNEEIFIDDFLVPLEQVGVVEQQKLALDYNLITSFRADRDSRYGVMSDILKQMQDVGAYKVSFEARRKRL